MSFVLQDAIHRIKEAFNKEFDEVYSKKEQEIALVKEKNKRIASIIAYLRLDEEIFEPTLSIAEKPELLLEVDESEVKCFLSFELQYFFKKAHLWSYNDMQLALDIQGSCRKSWAKVC